ncbi:gamma-glutamylaminecyclotransferase [Astyanax mexicanus]|uniref:Gamma-glutamylaminecyclotransferase n=1 Tax=Astyanax mexicanus TaxID=7994 RepID=A0A8B9GLM8_ASTMX|nr:gamma-glutamylaminecyclotransferase [Astyanax mexicanus]
MIIFCVSKSVSSLLIRKLSWESVGLQSDIRRLLAKRCCPSVVQMTHVFVYGTLKKGQPNHDRMLDVSNGKSEFLCSASTVEKYPLIIAGKYNVPFLLNIPGKGQHVHGEIYSVDEKMLKFLDWFESCPHMYQRTRVLLKVEQQCGEGGEERPELGSTTEAFVYSTTTYEPDWLENTAFSSYDSYGDHGLLYVTREARDSR